MKQRLIVSLIVLPGTVAIVVPAAIIFSTRGQEVLSTNLLLVLPGLAFVALGLYLAARSMSLFAIIGKGTLAPWDPPEKLVVEGVYRHVRNPMITGVLSVLLGEALMAESFPLLVWFLAFMLGNFIWIPKVEEPALVERFGDDYETYRKNVPRWIPRLKPWIQA